MFWSRIRRTILSLWLLVVPCSLATRVESAQAGMDEEQMAAALDQLGQLLGLPEVTAPELKSQVETVGQLRFRSSVPIDFMSREALADYIRRLFEEEYPRELSEREGRMLRAFGFLDAGADLRSLRERVLKENVAGFYDERPGVKKLFAISSGRTLNLLNQMILAHELRHALQDQHVVIRDQFPAESDYDDRRLAALCLFEGDATLLMEQYLMAGVSNQIPGMAELFQGFSQGMSGQEIAMMFAGPALRDAPPVVQEQLVAPYLDGRRLAGAIFAKGGFELLNRSLARPPRSMEQVLHPEKYLTEIDEPLEVTLAEASQGAADFEGRLGELYIRVLLDQELESALAATAAAGWGGDRWALVRGTDGHRLVWRSLWDSERDAVEFHEAFATFVERRFGAESDRLSLERSGNAVRFERRGVR